MKLKEKLEAEFDLLIKHDYLKITDEEMKKKSYEIFKGLFFLNYLSKRAELERFFVNDSIKVSMSCLVESIFMVYNNYNKVGLLILRSSIENYLKFQIELIGEGLYKVNDRNFTINKVEMEKIIKDRVHPKYKDIIKSNLSKNETTYSKTSALSHSLNAESKKSLIEYFAQIGSSNELTEVCLKYLNTTVLSYSEVIVYICKESFFHWELTDLREILEIMFSPKKTQELIAFIKSS